MWLRRLGRGIAIALAVVVAVVAIGVVGGVLWVRSERGRAWVIARITGFVDGKIRGHLTIGRLSGPLWGWVVLEDVRLYDLDGHEAGRAAQIAVEFDPWAAPRHRNHFHRLYVIEPDLQAKPLLDGRLRLDVLTRFFRERQKTLRIDGLVVIDGRARFAPLKGPLVSLAPARLIGRLFFVEHTRWGRADVLALDATLHLRHGPPRPAALDGTVRWDPSTRLAADGVHLHAGDTRIEGRAGIREDRFDLDLTRLHVAARDFHQLVPIEDPPADIHGRVAVHGPLEHLVVDLLLHPGEGTVHLRGHADWRHKVLTATVDHDRLRGDFFPSKPPFVISARVRLRVKYLGKGVEGPVELTGGRGSFKNVPFERGSATAVFFPDGVDFARAAMDIPGGAVSGHAHITFHGRVQLEARVLVSEARKLAKAVKGQWAPPTPPHGKSLLTVDVQLDKQRKQKPQFKVKAAGFGRPIVRTRDGRPL